MPEYLAAVAEYQSYENQKLWDVATGTSNRRAQAAMTDFWMCGMEVFLLHQEFAGANTTPGFSEKVCTTGRRFFSKRFEETS